jgi:threonine/homoserine/homoserine lactone efflux protein
MAASLWKALVFGVVVAGSIGPIALLIFGTAARRGFVPASYAALGAASADFIYAIAAFTVGALILPLLAAHEAPIRTGSALLLVGLGAWMLVSGVRSRDEAAPPTRASASFLPTFGLTLVNPMTLVFFAGFAPQLPVAGSTGAAAALALALFAGSLLVQLAYAGAGAALGTALPGERWQRALNLAAALGVLAFGLAGLV